MSGIKVECQQLKTSREPTESSHNSSACTTWTRAANRFLAVPDCKLTGTALFQEAYELVQVSTSLADPATRARELRACACAMARFGLDAATVVTMDEQEEVAVAEGTIHVVPAWRWLLD